MGQPHGSDSERECVAVWPYEELYHVYLPGLLTCEGIVALNTPIHITARSCA